MNMRKIYILWRVLVYPWDTKKKISLTEWSEIVNSLWWCMCTAIVCKNKCMTAGRGLKLYIFNKNSEKHLTVISCTFWEKDRYIMIEIKIFKIYVL